MEQENNSPMHDVSTRPCSTRYSFSKCIVVPVDQFTKLKTILSEYSLIYYLPCGWVLENHS